MTWIGLGCILVFALIGYFKGIWRVVGDLGSLILASIIAKFVSPIFSLSLVKKMNIGPKVLHSLISYVLTVLIIFIVFMVIVRVIIYRVEKRRVDAGFNKKKFWERMGGAAFGGLWGFVLILLVAMGILIIGNFQEVVQKTKINVKDFKRDYEIQKKGGGNSERYAGIDFKMIKNNIHSSMFGKIANEINPVNADLIKMYRDLLTILGNPGLFKKLKEHPTIIQFTKDPRILSVANDSTVRFYIRERMYYKLLDNSKIAHLVENKDLFDKLKKIDFKTVFSKIISSTDKSGVKKGRMIIK